MAESPFERACAAIDLANGEDPRGEEPLYSQRMVAWVRALAPAASEELRLAARAQHIRRWTVPRTRYPRGRTGYLKWREGLKRFHADTLGSIMKSAGFGAEAVAKAESLLVRKNLSADAEGQTLEDAACLVFLEFEFAAFSKKTPADQMIDILQKSWAKMSALGREHAARLKFAPAEAELVRRALGGSGPDA